MMNKVRFSRLIWWYATGIPFGILASLCFVVVRDGPVYAGYEATVGEILLNTGFVAGLTLFLAAPFSLFALWCWSRINSTASSALFEKNSFIRATGLVVLSLGVACVLTACIVLYKLGGSPWSFALIRDNLRAIGGDTFLLMSVVLATAFTIPRFVVGNLRGPLQRESTAR